MIGTTEIAASLSGVLVGAILGLIGGGGSILAVPLLIYGAGVTSPHIAIGTGALAVAVSALANLVNHARAGHVSWPCAIVFSSAGIVGAWFGSSLAKQINGQMLLTLFGALMVVVGLLMLRSRGGKTDVDVRLTQASASRLLPRLIGAGLAVGALSGFFGIGGGFLIVPGLMFATGMPLIMAIGTSLVSVTAFGATTAVSYALSGLIDWRLAAAFLVGGALGGLGGVAIANLLAPRDKVLRRIFAGVVVLVGIYVVVQGARAIA